MDSKYILTASGTFISVDELYHSGIKGMKWGVRRYQNPDGSLTPAGRKRYTNSDGTLNKKGEKYVAKETARLKAESDRLANQKRTSAKLSKLDQMRKKNTDLEDELNGKKTEEDEVKSKKETAVRSKEHEMSSLTNAEIDAYNKRMQSEENFKQLLEKRGYKVSLDQKTEIDQRIETLSKEKTLKQLEKEVANMSRAKTATEEKIELLTQQRDIAKLEKEIRDNTPKKESKISKFINSQAGQNLTNQLIKSGENVLTTYIKGKLGDKSDNNGKPNNNNKPGNNNKPNSSKPDNKNADLTSDAVKATVEKAAKILGKEAAKVAKSMEKQTKKQAEREAKEAEREAKHESERNAKTDRKEKVDYTVEGEGTSKRSSSAYGSNKSSKNSGDVLDFYEDSDGVYRYRESSPVTSLTTTRNVSSGSSYVSRNSDTSVTKLLSSSSNDHEYIKRIETDDGYRYYYKLPSSSSSGRSNKSSESNSSTKSTFNGYDYESLRKANSDLLNKSLDDLLKDL